MKVMLVIHSYYPYVGGAEVFTRQVAENLARRGDHVDLVTLKTEAGLSRLETDNGVTIHRIGIRKICYLSFLLNLFRLVRYILRLNKARDYDLLHSVGDGLPTYACTLIKKLKGKPHLITIQGGRVSAGFQSDFAEKISRQLTLWSFKNADSVHVISQSLGQAARALGAKNPVVIPNGFDDKFFRPGNKKELRGKYSFPLEERIIVSVARLVPAKGIDCLIRAIGLVAPKFSNLRLLVIGEGEQRRELETLIEQLNLNHQVQLLGFRQPQQISDYLGLADMMVLSSRHEGLGIALIEAMASGVPVIGSSVDGIPDLIQPERNGILVPPDDEEKLAEAIERLLQDQKLRDSFIREGLQKVREKYPWSAILLRIDEVYAGLIQGNKAMKAAGR